MDYLIHLAILVSIYAILAISLNLVVGYTGIISITHAAFFGVGAYSVAVFGTKFGVNFFAGLILGILISVILAFLVGRVLNKFRGDFVALGSVGFNVIIYSIFLNWQSQTRGPLGIPGIERPGLFGFSFSDNFSFLILCLTILLLLYVISHLVISSSFGRVLKAIREDEEALEVFGFRALYFKLAIFVIGAAMASVAGSLFASYITFIDPSTFTINESIFLLSAIILGGLASNRGAVLGAAVLVLLPEILRFVGFPSEIAAQMRQVIYGLLLVLVMLYKPRGFMGKYKL